MFVSWHFILFIIVYNTVNVQSHERTTHSLVAVKKHTRRAVAGDRQFQVESPLISRGQSNGDDSQDENDDSSENEKLGVIVSVNEADDNDDDGGDEKQDKSDSKEKRDGKRSLQAGDIFTPMDLLPVAVRLLRKVSEGRGIVSSSKSPEDLSDKLFAAYFLTTKRIVRLTDKDLSGLDALQALALEGQAVKMRSAGDSITEAPVQMMDFNGQIIGMDDRPVRCHYKLMHKKDSPSDTALRKGRSEDPLPFDKILKMEKNMSPNRHLIINQKRKKQNNRPKLRTGDSEDATKDVETAKYNGHKKKKGTKVIVQKVMKNGKQKVRKLKSGQKLKRQESKNNRQKTAKKKNLKKQRKPRKKNNRSKKLRNRHNSMDMPITTTKRPSCKWRYICRVPGDLDTCRLHTSCKVGDNNRRVIDNKYVDPEEKKEIESNKLLMKFRKMMGLTAVDEEVEKIIEQHVLLIKPENMAPDKKIETLEQYFNNIIMAQQTTTAYQSTNQELDGDVSSSTESEDLDRNTDTDKDKDKDLRASGNKASTIQTNVREQPSFHTISKTTVPIMIKKKKA